MRIELLSGVALMTFASAGVAHAQTVPPTSTTTQAPSAASGDRGAGQVRPSEPTAAGTDAVAQSTGDGLADIVVTAQRVSENSQKAAVAINVVGGADLLKGGVSTVDQLNTLVPALTVQSAGSFNFFFLRGVGNFAAGPNTDPAVAFNYDGVYVGRPTSAAGTFYDLERVEVLKGPQGTLYGRNATGGAINVLPVQPKIGQLSGFGSVSYGNYNSINAQGAVNVPLGEEGAFRVAGNFVKHDGYLSDGQSDEDTQSLRVQMKAKLTPDLTVRVSGDYAHTGGAGAGYTYIDAYTYNPALTTLPLGQRFTITPSNLSLSEGSFSPASQAFRQTRRAGPSGRNLDAQTAYPFQHNDFYGANAEINYETGIGTLTVVPAWRASTLNNLGGIGFSVLTGEKSEQHSVEARLGKTGVGIFDYNVGLFYYDEYVKEHTFVNQSSLANQQDFTTGTKSYAAFGRLTAHLGDRLRVVGGIRYTQDNKNFDGTSSSLVLVCVVPTGCPNAALFQLYGDYRNFPYPIPPAGVRVGPGPVPGTILSRTDNAVHAIQKIGKPTYRGAVEIDVTSRSLAYASVETGYRSGGFNLATGYETFNPEYITAFTIGSKNRFFDNRVQLNIEAFYWKYRNQQVSHVSLDRAGTQGRFTENVGSSTIKGAEVEGKFLLTPKTLLNADVQYLDSVYENFVYQNPVGTSPPYTTCGVALSSNPAFYNVDCSGKPGFNSPKWTINLGAQQTFNVGDYKVVLGADTQYKSSYYISFDYRPSQLIGPVWRSNATISFGSIDDRWNISGFVRNIEGDRTPMAASTQPFGLLEVVIPTAPRTYGVQINGRF
ncbi:iron complex outermembrane receptor protein [Sphingomonas sp. UYAg733]